MQKFFESTLISSYIKYLLSCNPIPTYPVINTDDYLIAGATYIYKHDILKCTQSGRFNGIKSTNIKSDYLYVSDDITVTDNNQIMKHLRYNTTKKEYEWVYYKDEGPYPTPNDFETNSKYDGGLTVTDDFVRLSYLPTADFEIVSRYNFGAYVHNVTKQFVSNVNYYDSKTHRTLGEYLRCLRDIKGVDLMGLYNCFDYTIAENISLSDGKVNDYANPKTKVILIPIKFNKTYTMAIDCPFSVSVCPVFYDGKNLIKDSNNESMTDKLSYLFTKYNSLQFINPQTFKIKNDPSEIVNIGYNASSVEELKAIEKATKYCVNLSNFEKYLYLAIQLPKSNTSSIVVLEGEYTSNTGTYTASAQNIENLGEPRLSSIFRSELSLLSSNTNTQVPFSDKLIEYLLRYTIDDREYIDDNVANIETKIGYNPNLKNFYPGIWDKGLRFALYTTYMNLPNKPWINKKDIFGFVDLDIESAVNRGEMLIKTQAERGLSPYYGD